MLSILLLEGLNHLKAIVRSINSQTSLPSRAACESVLKMNQTKNEMCGHITHSSEEENINAMARLALRRRAIERTLKNDEKPQDSLQIVRSTVHDQIISLLHELVKEVMRCSESPFFTESGQNRSFVRCTPLGQKLREVAGADFYQIEADYPLHNFSPIYNVFSRLHRLVPFYPSSYFDVSITETSADQIVATAMRFVEALRRALSRESVKKANENFRRGAMDNFNSLSDSLGWLAQRHQHVIGLRFDLHERATGSLPAKMGDKASLNGLDEFMACRERFHRSLDRRFGHELLGYFWALEYGRESKFHVHYFVLLDPRGNEDHVGLVDMLGDKWVSLTEGRGYIYNGNTHADRQAYPALGLVNLSDPRAIKGLQFLMSYLTLAGLFVKLEVNKRFRTFAKGRFPKEPLRKPGRPRERASDSRLKISVAEARASFMKFI